MNLAVNARDAMPKGGVMRFSTAEVQLLAHPAESVEADQPRLAPGAYLQLRVADNGIGMVPEVSQRVFEPFFTTKPAGKGTGLGLSAVYGTMRAHKGTVSVQSTPGEGTEFTILLPISRTGVEAQAQPASRLDGNAPIQAATVLVVDDEDPVRDIVSTALRECGHRVLEAADGRAAIEVFEAHCDEIDAVVLDLVMPSMHGSEVVPELRRIRRDVRVIVATGYAAMDEESTEALDVVAVLRKPFTVRELLATVHAALMAQPPRNLAASLP